MLSKLAETEVLLLERLYGEDYPDQDSLCVDASINKSTGSKALQRLKNRNLVQEIKRGKFKQIRLNRNKKPEVKRLLAIWKKFNYVLKDKSKVLIRVHDFEAYAGGCFVPKTYPRETYTKHTPKNRLCISKEIEGVASFTLTLSELDSWNNSIQIFISPFYIVLPIDSSKEEIERQITEQNNRRVHFLVESLKKEEIYVGDSYHLSEGSAALVDDWLAELAVRNHIKNRNIDESHYLIPEYEVHGPDLVEKIHKIIKLRQLILDNKISELELTRAVEQLNKSDKI